MALVFSHTQQYLKISGALITNALVNGWLAVSTIAAFRLVTRLYSAQSGSKGITESHLQAVVLTVGQIAKHHIDGAVWNVTHHLQAISEDDAVGRDLPYRTSISQSFHLVDFR